MRASGYDRHADDWYVEPAWAVDALMDAERKFVGLVLDPCCGGGNIVKRLEMKGIFSFGSDIKPRWPPAAIQNFYVSLETWRPDSVVSNPPYNLAREFIDCALEHTTDRVCVLLRLAFLEGIKRREWFGTVPLARVWVSSRRMSMPPGGSGVKAKNGTVAFAWFVFEHGHTGAPAIGWI
ncbi:hypothetical protein AD942_11025 [Gluconobacter japonicus]|uniref:hypothetical protein n=1 Tax=Gluconobacter japonicus TaxID=376620 RepID=UPI000785F741|nr:hypothetical protein [Gluconobacter japonicus]KXV23858.1 hypothetical protein AD936_20980 [Gluconobacter japonicus]KXV39281.1 hypothetical protein AD942_11025 [Gluconobacter japonicus]